MERQSPETGVIELGTASTDTHGSDIFNLPEPGGYVKRGMFD